MDIIEAIHAFHIPRKWVTKESTREEVLQIETNVRRFREAERVVDSPETYQGMSAIEGQKVALLALELYDMYSDSEAIEYLPQRILTHLANGVPGSLQGLYSRLLERDLSWGSNSMFREADPAIRDRIITFFEDGGQELYSREDLLCALSWIGDERVRQRFLSWQLNPPAWSKNLSIPFEKFTYEAGWELNEKGEKRNLYYQANYDLKVRPVGETAIADNSNLIVVVAPHEGKCGWCGRHLVSLFDIDLSNPRIVLPGIQGERLCIALCINCSAQNYRVFTEVDLHGSSHWSLTNGERPSHFRFFDEKYFSASTLLQNQIILGQARGTPYVDQGSHIGGCPGWVQDADFPCCPRCQQTMMFFGQYEPYQIPYLEGIFYAFLCISCGIAATSYQQT